MSALILGGIVQQYVSGLCLDVGCGIVPTPSYMIDQDTVKFIGIDPDTRNTHRSFPYVCAIGECLPFKDNTFNGVLFASAIDHMIEPWAAVRESSRVLVNNGVLIIWYTNRIIDRTDDPNHKWQFNTSSIWSLVSNSNFVLVDDVHIEINSCERVLIARKE